MRCETAQPLLSEYIDNALSARDTWEVDKHLTDCHACTRLLNELRQTARVVADAPRFEVSPDFMERLHARIAALEPEPPRRAWASNLRALLRPRILPAWGAAMAASVWAFTLLLPPRSPAPILPPVAEMTVTQVQMAKIQYATLSASDPLADLTAANLDAQDSEATP
jgi:anti-sigma factor RsiW